MSWVSDNTIYVEAHNIDPMDYPTHIEISKEEFEEMFGERTYAVYAKTNNEILTRHSATDEEWFEGIIIHETIHFLQSYYKEEPECDSAKEAYAYKVANSWFAENNEPDRVVPDVLIQLISLCKNNHYE